MGEYDSSLIHNDGSGYDQGQTPAPTSTEQNALIFAEQPILEPLRPDLPPLEGVIKTPGSIIGDTIGYLYTLPLGVGNSPKEIALALWGEAIEAGKLALDEAAYNIQNSLGANRKNYRSRGIEIRNISPEYGRASYALESYTPTSEGTQTILKRRGRPPGRPKKTDTNTTLPITDSEPVSPETLSFSDLLEHPEMIGDENSNERFLAEYLFARALAQRSVGREIVRSDFEKWYRQKHPNALQSSIDAKLSTTLSLLKDEIGKYGNFDIVGLGKGRAKDQKLIKVVDATPPPIVPLSAEISETPSSAPPIEKPYVTHTEKPPTQPEKNPVDASVFGSSKTELLRYVLSGKKGRSIADISVARRRDDRTKGPAREPEIATSRILISSLNFELPQGVTVREILDSHGEKIPDVYEVYPRMTIEEIIRLKKQEAEISRTQGLLQAEEARLAREKAEAVEREAEEARRQREIQMQQFEDAVGREVLANLHALESKPRTLQADETTTLGSEIIETQPTELVTELTEGIPTTISTESKDVTHPDAADVLVAKLEQTGILKLLDQALQLSDGESLSVLDIARQRNPQAKRIKQALITQTQRDIMTANKLLKEIGLAFEHPIQDGVTMTYSVVLKDQGNRPVDIQELLERIRNTSAITQPEPVVEVRDATPQEDSLGMISRYLYRGPKNKPTKNGTKPQPFSRTDKLFDALEIHEEERLPIHLSSDPTDMKFSVGEAQFQFAFGNQKKLLEALAGSSGQELTREQLASLAGVNARAAEMNFASLQRMLNENAITKGLLEARGVGHNQRFILKTNIIKN